MNNITTKDEKSGKEKEKATDKYLKQFEYLQMAENKHAVKNNKHANTNRCSAKRPVPKAPATSDPVRDIL